ncbi:MAG: hypothetical protein M3422_24540, partial [Actinomycetota bacterium]|nr:hypothetical protein [Actinomycetota bacterium]
MAVPVPKQRDFLHALSVLPPRDPGHLYWIANATLTGSVADTDVFDPVFARWFGAGTVPVPEVEEPGEEDRDGGTDDGVPPDQAAREGEGARASWSSVERQARFTPDDDAVLARVRSALPAAVPTI